jgi:hypothetical protein
MDSWQDPPNIQGHWATHNSIYFDLHKANPIYAVGPLWYKWVDWEKEVGWFQNICNEAES